MTAVHNPNEPRASKDFRDWWQSNGDLTTLMQRSSAETAGYVYDVARRAYEGGQAARAQGVTAPMTRIAEKKLEQMGATVHGVLAKNEVGRWVAVSEAGRVMWLDNFEGQSSSAQGEPSSGVPAGWTVWRDDDGYIRIDSPKDAHVCWKRDKNLADSHPLNMLADLGEAMLTAAPTPEAGQSGGEPVAEVIATGGLDKKWVNIHVMSADKLNMGDKLYTHPHTNQPGSKQGGEWVRCDERLPTEADGNLIWSHDQKRGSVELCSWAWSHSLFKHGYITHWQPTGLTRPQPPKSKEGE